MSSPLPKQIQEQIKQTEEVVAKLNAGEVSPDSLQRDVVDLDLPTVHPKPMPQQADQVQEQPPQTAEAPQEPKPEPKAPEKESDWEQRYKTLQGMFRAEREQSDKRINELSDKLNAFMDAAEEEKITRSQSTFNVSEQEIEDYGEDFLDMVSRQAVHAVSDSPVFNKILARLDKLEGNVTQVNTNLKTSARDRLFATLDKEVPDWRKLNVDEGFLTWLSEVDQYAGELRSDMLTEAYEANDAARVAKFFNGYKQERNITDTQAGTEQVAKMDMGDMVSAEPSATGMAYNPSKRAPRKFTQAEIASFYDPRRKKGDPAAEKALEAEIFQAMNQGLVI